MKVPKRQVTLRTCAALVITFLFPTETTRAEVQTNKVDPVVTAFARAKHRQAETLAAKLNLFLPPRLSSFFEAAEQGDWLVVSNRFDNDLLREAGVQKSGPHPEMMNELWAPAHETLGLYEVYAQADPGLLREFAERILAVMATNALYFGGTDAGRFAVTAFNDQRERPKVVVLTQNALADLRYMSYVREVYGSAIWLPAVSDIQQGFTEYCEDYKKRDPLPGEKTVFHDGQVTVQGVGAVMIINGILARMIVEKNGGDREIFVEESYAIPWMYPRLVPCGPILKLNRQRQGKFSANVVNADRQYWDALSKELIGDVRFVRSVATRKIFAKLRAAIGGVYEFHEMKDEAEYAYQQALLLSPVSPDALVRLARLRVGNGQMDEAAKLLGQISDADLDNDLKRAEFDTVKARLRPANSR